MLELQYELESKAAKWYATVDIGLHRVQVVSSCDLLSNGVSMDPTEYLWMSCTSGKRTSFLVSQTFPEEEQGSSSCPEESCSGEEKTPPDQDTDLGGVCRRDVTVWPHPLPPLSPPPVPTVAPPPVPTVAPPPVPTVAPPPVPTVAPPPARVPTVDAQLQVVRKLEEKEHLLQSSIGTGEKELGLRTQALVMSKRKAMDAAQLADDLKAQLELAQKQLHDFQEEIVENRATREKEMFNLKRAEEDISRLRRKLETTKKPDMVPNCDEILMEGIKDYKACLTCPCCNMRKKDAVLTRCFHVFCFECVKTRYDTRQRKCPKCNAAFGANDSHRIYIG
ncbi:LOW QUALITY PROTEIN: E3 ubiquitin-protein ligase BRE1A-like [Anomalospiza imberbis]|uniref:LOW QUALITY PROTEIN: E3 ubiquitin-protein ligase BRE1A-like n=1 Tax=Anomalospiza imberbis TaxID=187417 RepID=UPI00358DF4D2